MSTEDDARLPAVREAVGFWNAELARLGSPFRLGTIVHIVETIPVGDLYALRPSAGSLPDSIQRVNGDLIVALSDSEFTKGSGFAVRLRVHQKAVVAIQSSRGYPLTLPGGARNVVAHELGHAIGLDHNDDTAALMCGGSPLCYSRIPNEGFLPLTNFEEVKLLEMYPPNWRDRPKRWKEDPPLGLGAG